MVKTKLCIDCDKDITGVHNRTVRCDTCKGINRKLQQKRQKYKEGLKSKSARAEQITRNILNLNTSIYSKPEDAENKILLIKHDLKIFSKPEYRKDKEFIDYAFDHAGLKLYKNDYPLIKSITERKFQKLRDKYRTSIDVCKDARKDVKNRYNDTRFDCPYPEISDKYDYDTLMQKQTVLYKQLENLKVQYGRRKFKFLQNEDATIEEFLDDPKNWELYIKLSKKKELHRKYEVITKWRMKQRKHCS